MLGKVHFGAWPSMQSLRELMSSGNARRAAERSALAKGWRGSDLPERFLTQLASEERSALLFQSNIGDGSTYRRDHPWTVEARSRHLTDHCTRRVNYGLLAARFVDSLAGE